MTWIWLSEEVIFAIHDRQIAEHGGAAGVRDASLVRSALARPMNMAAYESGDVFDLAAAYGFGIARNHGFVDGNKRTAYVATLLFLRLNGALLTAPAVDRVLVFESLGAGQLALDTFAAWLRKHGEKKRE